MPTIDPRKSADRTANRAGGTGGVLRLVFLFGLLLMVGGGILHVRNNDALLLWLDDVLSQPRDIVLDEEPADDETELWKELVREFAEATDDEQWKAALVLADSYIANWPDYYYGYVIRAYANWGLAECEKSLYDIDRASAREPDDQYTYFLAAYCHAYQGDLQTAQRVMDRAIEIGTNDVDPYELAVMAGWLAFADGRFAEAAEHFALAANFDQANENVLAMEWLSYAHLGEQRDDLLAPDRLSKVAADGWGEEVVRLMASEITQAEFLQRLADHPAAYFYVGQYHELLKEWDEAIEAYEQAERLPESAWLEIAVAKRRLQELSR